MSLSLAGNGTLTGVDADASGLLAEAGGIGSNVVSVTKTDTFTTTSTSYTDITGLTVSITPSSATSKVLVLFNVFLGQNTSAFANLRLVRDSTDIAIGDASSTLDQVTASSWTGGADNHFTVASASFLDSPATTSATTYKVQLRCAGPSQLQYVNRSRRDTGTTDPRAVSSITVIEVAA